MLAGTLKVGGACMLYTISIRRVTTYLGITCLLMLGGAACGGGGGGKKPITSGLRVGVSDTTPACSAQYQHVYVTIADVDLAQSSPSGGSTAAAAAINGGTSITPGLSAAPKQVDLFAPTTASNQCLAQVLGTTGTIAAGAYNRMFVVLMPNSAPSPGVSPPSPNACASLVRNVFNCVQTANGAFEAKVLRTDVSTTGIALSQSKIANGALVLQESNNSTVDVDFDTCQSLIPLSSNQLAMKPAVRAGLLSSDPTVSGQIVHATLNGSVVTPTTTGVSGAQVWLEQQSRTATVAGETGTPASVSVENLVQATVSDASGNFTFCPVAQGSYEIVADAAPLGVGTFPSFPTVTTGVAMSTMATTGVIVPLVQQTTAPVLIAGLVSGTANNEGVPLDVRVAATQQTTLMLSGTGTGGISASATPTSTPTGGVAAAQAPVVNQAAGDPTGPVQVLIPTFANGTAPTNLLLTTNPNGTTAPSCTSLALSCATGTDCACYSASVPSGEVLVGSMSTSGSGYTPQGSLPANYSI